MLLFCYLGCKICTFDFNSCEINCFTFSSLFRRAPPGKCSFKPTPVNIKGKLIHFSPKEGKRANKHSFFTLKAWDLSRAGRLRKIKPRLRYGLVRFSNRKGCDWIEWRGCGLQSEAQHCFTHEQLFACRCSVHSKCYSTQTPSASALSLSHFNVHLETQHAPTIFPNLNWEALINLLSTK